MGKVPTLAIVAIAVVLAIGISVAVFYLLIKPKKEELTQLRADLAAEQEVVAQKDAAEAAKREVDAAWLKAQDDLEALRERKSIHISLYTPLLAMTTMWYEYRDDLPRAVQSYLEAQGVTIQDGAAIPAAPLAPPTVPSSGFMQVPSAGPLNLKIRGTLAQIQQVYENLAQLPRIATIGALNLTGTGGQIEATIPLSLYILVEGAEAVAPPPAATPAGGEGLPPGMEGPKGPPDVDGKGDEPAKDEKEAPEPKGGGDDE